jgi:hypothetical protein
MTARDEVLAAARTLTVKGTDGTFTVDDIVAELRRRESKYAESTIRTHVASRMCSNAPDNHAVTYDDLVRTDSGRYRLA